MVDDMDDRSDDGGPLVESPASDPLDGSIPLSAAGIEKVKKRMRASAKSKKSPTASKSRSRRKKSTAAKGGAKAAPPALRVEILPPVRSIPLGLSSGFRARAYDGNNQVVADATFAWAAKDENVAAVKADTGLVTARALGQTQVTATEAKTKAKGEGKVLVFQP